MLSSDSETRMFRSAAVGSEYQYELEAAGWLVDIDRWLELEPEAQRNHFRRVRGPRR